MRHGNGHAVSGGSVGAPGGRHAARWGSFLVLILLAALLLVPAVASAASSGPRDAGAGQSAGTGTAWTNPGNITASGSPYATCALNGNGTSRRLEGTNYGFTIPSGAIIDGIQVSIQRMGEQGSTSGIYDTQVQLLKAGTATGTNKPVTGTRWPTALTAAGYGTSSDLWGTTWTPAQINASNFGVALTVRNSSMSGKDATVDYIRVTVTYRLPLTVTATGVARPYNGTTVATVTLDSADIVPAYPNVNLAYTSAAFDTKNVGSNKPVAVSGISIGGANAADYRLTSTTAATIADVTAIDLTVTADDQSKTYGDALDLGTAKVATSAMVGSESIGSVTLVSAGAAASAAAGDYAIIPSDAVAGAGTDLANYTIAYVDGGLTVDPKGLTITANNQSKTYGDALDLGQTAFTTAGLVGADEVTTVALDSTGAASNASVAGSPYVITASDAQGTGLANYDITYMDGSLSVDPKGLVFSGAVAQNKLYDGDIAADVTYGTLDGVIVPDEVSFDASLARARFDTKDAGLGKPVVVTGVTLTGGAAGNYTLAQPSGLTADITPLGITGSFTAADKVYDGNTDATVLTRGVHGTVTGDDVALIDGTAAFADKDAGPAKAVALTGAALDGTDAGNYTLGSVDDASAAITAKELTVTATGENKVYNGTTDASVTLDSADVVGSDAVTMDCTTAAFADKNVNTGIAVAVDGISISGTDAGDYELQNTTADTAADITPLGITGSFTAADKVYDGTTAATVLTRALHGAVTGDDVALTGGTAAFDDQNVGARKIVTLSGASLDGIDADNYTLGSVNDASAAITAKELTVDGAVAGDKIYDGTTSASVAFGPPGLVGVVGTEVVTLNSGAYTAAFASKDVGAAIPVVVDGLMLGGADAGNYTLAQPTLAADITPAALTVTAHGVDKVYDGTTAAGVTLSTDKVAGDAVAAHATSAVYASKDVGANKAIGVAGISIDGADAGNYTLQNATAQTAAAVTAKGLTIRANDQNKPAGLVFTFTGNDFTVSGLVTGDSVDSVAFSCAGADAASAAGTYPIVLSNAAGTGLGNYAVTYANGTMTVTGNPPVTVTYKFSAFAKPLRSKDSKKFHPGTTVVVKFTVKDASGAVVTTLRPKIKVTAKGFTFGPKTVKYNATKHAYIYKLKIGKTWKTHSYKLTTSLAGSTATRMIKFKVVK